MKPSSTTGWARYVVRWAYRTTVLFGVKPSLTERIPCFSCFGLQEADPEVLPPLAVLYMDKVSCSGLGDVYWVASHAKKNLFDAPKDFQKRFIDTQRYDVHVAMGTQLEDSGLVDLAMDHFRKAADLRPFDIALKVSRE